MNQARVLVVGLFAWTVGDAAAAPRRPAAPEVAKVMFWSGKVNQHFDLASKTWETDPDGSSGANVDRLAYCKKFYPNTTSVRELEEETIDTWRGAENTGAYRGTRISYECVQVKPIAKVMFWSGKVNQHVDLKTGKWLTDPDGSSGADVDRLAYCKKWYPGTTSVRTAGDETISTWRGAGNSGAHKGTHTAYECVAEAASPAGSATAQIMVWSGKVNQHVDLKTGKWMTDPDGSSGANVDRLAYCRKWYPGTTSVREGGEVTITTWRGEGNSGAHTGTQIAYECVASRPAVPQIMMWSGKVNQHVDLKTGKWMTDPDGSSGADVDRLAYCQKWYPDTTFVRAGEKVAISTWRAGGNAGAFTGTQTAYECVAE